MAKEPREVLSDMIHKLKQERDELALQIHLGKAELKDEWRAVDDKLAELTHRFEPLNKAVAETSEDVWESLQLLGNEIMQGFHRIRKSL